MKTPKAIILGLCFVVAVGFITQHYTQTPPSEAGSGAERKAQSQAGFIPSRCELQEMLNKAEPNDPPLKIDCIIGAKTLAKWNRVCGNQYARKFMTPSGAPRKEN